MFILPNEKRYFNNQFPKYIQKQIDNLKPEQIVRIQEVKLLAENLFKQHKIDYDFKFTHYKQRNIHGMCHYTDKLITLKALNVLEAKRYKLKEINNALLHEIAHAIVGPGFGHRKEWQNKARELGVTWQSMLYKEYK